MYGLRVWGTWTLLLESLSRGLIEVADVENAVGELGKRRHKLKEKQALEILTAAKRIASTRKEQKTKRQKTKKE
jgi:hypothetical protein